MPVPSQTSGSHLGPLGLPLVPGSRHFSRNRGYSPEQNKYILDIYSVSVTRLMTTANKQMCIEHLLCAGSCSRYGEYSSEQTNYLLNTYCMPGTGETVVTKKDKVSALTKFAVSGAEGTDEL